MKKLNILFALMITVLLSSCITTMEIPADLSQADVMEVKGRQGWMFNQKLQFGDYQSGKVKRGWTKSYSIDFLLKFSGAKEKLRFELENGSNKSEVFCMSKIKRTDLPVMGGFFHIPLEDENTFAGTSIYNSERAWNFIIYYPSEPLFDNSHKGMILNGKDIIEIREITRNSSGKSTWLVLGFEFIYNGKVVGAVETLNMGRIIIDKNISEEMKNTIAAVSAALLLRSEISTEV